MKILLTTLVLFTIVNSCLAEDDISSSGKNHTLSVHFGLGNVDSDIPTETADDDTLIAYTYDYKFNSNWAINTGLISGESLCLITCSSENTRTLNYDSYIFDIKGSLPLSSRWSVFTKLGANYFNVKYSGNKKITVKDSGVGLLFASGLGFRAYNGLGLGIEFTYLDMGKITTENFTLNLSYMF